jgi:hypothetical protein
MYFVTRLWDVTLQATAEHVALTSYGGVSWTCARIRTQQAGEKTFRNTLAHLEQQIMQQQPWSFTPLLPLNCRSTNDFRNYREKECGPTRKMAYAPNCPIGIF